MSRFYLLGGVVSLISYWRKVASPMLSKIKGRIAIVKAEECKNGDIFLYIDLPLIDGRSVKLRVWGSDLDEGDVVDVSSIVVLFIDTPDGKTLVRYSAIYLDNEEDRVPSGFIRDFISNQCSMLMKKQHEKEEKLSVKVPDSFIKAAEKATYIKKPRQSYYRSSPDYVDAVGYYEDPIINHYSDDEEDWIYGMYDGNVDTW